MFSVFLNMGAREIWHFCAAAHFWFGCYYDWNYVLIPKHITKIEESSVFTGKLKYLTYWNAVSNYYTFIFDHCVI